LKHYIHFIRVSEILILSALVILIAEPPEALTTHPVKDNPGQPGGRRRLRCHTAFRKAVKASPHLPLAELGAFLAFASIAGKLNFSIDLCLDSSLALY
jgi:hypothetical protein